MLKKIFKPDQGEISFGTLLSSFCFWICFCSWGNSKRVLLVLLSEEKKPWMEETQSGACLADRLALSHSQEEGKIRTPITLNSMSYPFLPTFHQTSQDLDFCERKQECYKKRGSSWLQLLTGSRLYWSCLVLNVENQKNVLINEVFASFIMSEALHTCDLQMLCLLHWFKTSLLIIWLKISDLACLVFFHDQLRKNRNKLWDSMIYRVINEMSTGWSDISYFLFPLNIL